MKCFILTYKIFSAFLIILLVVAGCAGLTNQPVRHQTERLYLERQYIGISHIGEKTGAQQARVLGEQVNFSAAPLEEKALADTPDRLDTTHVYALSEVVVTSRARFAPVRQGQIDIDFLVRVPASFMADDFQLTLTPHLLVGDSVKLLEDVVLRGQNFIARQQEDYSRFEEYLATIVDASAYDSAFVDHQNVDRELNRRRRNELSGYYNRWVLMQEYRQWRNTEQEKYDRYNIIQASKLRQKLEKQAHTYQVDLRRLLATGQDTATLGQQYRRRRQGIIASAPVHRQITLEAVPSKYREFYLNNVGPENLEPTLPSEEDSVRIVSDFVLHEKIAVNEMRGSRQQEMFRYMVPYPYRPDAHYLAPITMPGKDYVYRYTQSYPVTPDLRNIRLTLGGHVAAVDRSRYNIQRTDTLSFIVSSMDELAEGSLVSNPAFSDEQRRQYTFALQLLRAREYQRALTILNEYKDYNTALTLACLGYDHQAYDLLGQLEQTPNTHYLSSIVCYRLSDIAGAMEHLKQACRLDESKIDRINRDPDIVKMVRDYKIEL